MAKNEFDLFMGASGTNALMPQREKTAAIYTRFSSNKQNPESAEDQRLPCTRMAEADGMVIEERYCFTDQAKSGATTAGRSAFQRMIRMATSSKCPFSAIYAESTSRFGRNMREVLANAFILLHHSITVVFVQQNLRTSDPQFRIFGSVYALFDEVFLEQLRMNTKRGLEALVHKGKNPGKRVYGYQSRPVLESKEPQGAKRPMGSVFEPIPDLLNVVKSIFDMRRTVGASTQRIAATLNRQFITSSAIQPPSGECWKAHHIETILKEDLYSGWLVWGKKTTARHPETGKKQQRPVDESKVVRKHLPELAVINRQEWEAVQRSFPGRRALKGERPLHLETANKKLLTGLMCCGECGARMIAPHGGRWGYYACKTNHERGSKRCGNDVRLGRLQAEETARREITAICRNPTHAAQVATTLRTEITRHIEEEYYRPNRENLTAKIERLREERTAVIKMVESGKMLEGGDDIISTYDGKIAEAERLLSLPSLDVLPNIEDHLPNALVADHYADLANLIETGETAKTTIDNMIKKIDIHPLLHGARLDVFENIGHLSDLALNAFFLAMPHGKYPSGTLLSFPVSIHCFELPIIARRQRRMKF